MRARNGLHAGGLCLALGLIWGSAFAQRLEPVPLASSGITKPQLLEQVLDNASALNFVASQARWARWSMGGAVDCPIFPEPWDVVIDNHMEGTWTLLLIRPGEATPCAAFRCQGPKDGQGWREERLKEIPALSSDAAQTLAMVRAARKKVDRALGSGQHIYALQSGSFSEGVGVVYAWSEIETGAKEGRDQVLIGPCAVVLVLGGGAGYYASQTLVVHDRGLSWDTRSVKKKAPFSIRSVQDLGDSVPTEFDILRCRANPALCPRLFLTGCGALVLEADGTHRLLNEKESRKAGSLDPAYLPKEGPIYTQMDQLREAPQPQAPAPPLLPTPAKTADPQLNHLS